MASLALAIKFIHTHTPFLVVRVDKQSWYISFSIIVCSFFFHFSLRQFLLFSCPLWLAHVFPPKLPVYNKPALSLTSFKSFTVYSSHYTIFYKVYYTIPLYYTILRTLLFSCNQMQKMKTKGLLPTIGGFKILKLDI